MSAPENTCTSDLALRFCQAYFTRRNAKEATDLCATNVVWLSKETLHGKQAVEDAIRKDIVEHPTPFTIECLSKEELGNAASSALLHLRLSSKSTTTDAMLTLISVMEEDAPKISYGQFTFMASSLDTPFLVHPDDMDTIRDMTQKLQEGKLQVLGTIRFRTSEKEPYRWLNCTSTIIPNTHYLRGRTEQSEIDEKSWLEAKQQYAAAVKSGYYSFGNDILAIGNCNISQDRILMMKGRFGEELLKRFGPARNTFFQKFGALIHNDAQRTTFYSKFLNENVIQDFARGLYQQTMEADITLDGTTYTAQASVEEIMDPQDGTINGFFTLRDLTQSKMQSQVLDATIRIDYDYIGRLDLKDGMMAIYAGKGKNDQLDRYGFGTSFPFEDAARQTTEEYVVPEDRERYLRNMTVRNVSDSLKTSDFYEFTFAMKEKNGEIRTKRARFFAYDRNGGIIVFSRTDITELVRQETEQKQVLRESLSIAQSANKSKSDFLAFMSHDIRTPMNAIVGMCDLALEDTKDSTQVNESLRVIKSSSKLLLSILNDILDMSRIESGKMTLAEETFSISEHWVQWIKEKKALAEKAGLTLTSSSDIKNDHCTGDAVRIQRILDNIVSNAIKFTPRGGSITCALQEMGYQNKNFGLYRFTFMDTGIGMSVEQQEHIFEPFYRAENARLLQTEGTGLGLSIAKSIAECMGGTIFFTSEEGKGSTFSVTLPLKLAETTLAEAKGNEAGNVSTISLKGLKVLVCEDHPVNQMVMTRILEKAGVIVTIAANGKAGYEAFLQSEKGHYQLILMDIQMPVMNGYEATEAIRESTHPQAKTIPIIALTANAFAEDTLKSRIAGMNGHLAKPITPKELYDAVKRYAV
jgi:signal transduction histidine kinase